MLVNDIIKVEVTGIKEYGAFVKYNEYAGLIHISEFSDDYVKNISSIVSVGEIINVMVLDIDEKEKKLKLSFKKANMVDKKVLKFTKINIGFKSLEDNMEKWIKEYKK